ncbi:hypothetical protein [Rahnella sikkimica]|uniref:hypothetical protein n=1 Tax=Rahnella sikkimica TaxID=1805933 RepID=UPI0018659844|nr:hypothetical protein [Rahnella sikkimica]
MRSLIILRFLTARYPSLAMFQVPPLLPQTPPLRGTLISVFEPFGLETLIQQTF